MTKPIVLVSADVKPIDGHEWHAAAQSYLKAALAGAGAIPLILPSLGDELDLDAVLDRVDGVLLTGSRSNVNPELYGQEASEADGPYDPQRDATTLPLIRKTLERGLPLFAICRGHQELNVALGGTLATEIQNIEGRDDHRAPESEDQDKRYGLAHLINVQPDCFLDQILKERADSAAPMVNSLHRQAIDVLAPTLNIEAASQDGVIEATSVRGAKTFALSTQWHPEYWVNSDETSQKLFAAFGKAMREKMSERLPATPPSAQ